MGLCPIPERRLPAAGIVGLRPTLVMRKIPVKIEQSPEGDWWVQSSEVLDVFACGETKEEALENALEVFAISLGVDESSIKLKIVETRIASNGEDG